jgi:hypothetical protein
MKHEVWFDKEHNVLREKFLGGFTEEDVPEYLSRMRAVYNNSGDHCRVIVDLSQASQPFYNKKTRELLIQGSAKQRYIEERVAMVNAKPDIRMLIKVLVAGMKHKGKDIEARFFDSEEEALGWLNGNGH